MLIKFKKTIADAPNPIQEYGEPAGADLTAVSVKYDKAGDYYEYHTGIAVEIPTGHVGLIFPRSSVRKYKITQTNCVGVIDPDYRGEILVCFRYRNVTPWYKRIYNKIAHKSRIDCAPYKVGEKCCQLVITTYTKAEYKEVAELNETERGAKGHGSSDNKK